VAAKAGAARGAAERAEAGREVEWRAVTSAAGRREAVATPEVEEAGLEAVEVRVRWAAAAEAAAAAIPGLARAAA
jgi:hypothetical protein